MQPYSCLLLIQSLKPAINADYANIQTPLETKALV